jgi:hypothetical protein
MRGSTVWHRRGELRLLAPYGWRSCAHVSMQREGCDAVSQNEAEEGGTFTPITEWGDERLRVANGLLTRPTVLLGMPAELIDGAIVSLAALKKEKRERLLVGPPIDRLIADLETALAGVTRHNPPVLQ